MTDRVPFEVEPMEIDAELARRVMDELGQNVYLCYQCAKCTSGCPLAEFLDWHPNQIMRALQLGQEDIALHAETPWLCASCQTCTTRCPQGLDITAIMDFLTREMVARGVKPPVPEVEVFNQAFLREVRLWGRSFELGMLAELKLRTASLDNLTDDLDLGVRLMRKGKLPFFPSPSRPPKKAQPVVGAPTAIAYYPGCSLHATATEFDRSTRAVCEALGLTLVEPRGWVCCGSSSAHRADPALGLQLPLQNLSTIEQSGFEEVTMPCAACFNRHKTALYEISHDPRRKSEVSEALGYEYQNRVKVNTLINTILEHVGPEKLGARVVRPLDGLRLVSYYGCLLTRPPQVTGAEHHENPTAMDVLLSATGAEVLDWSYKTSCCGASHSLSKPHIAIQLSKRIIDHARQVGAEAIAVACPLCHTNLDARQAQMGFEEPLPILFFTQLLGLAFDLPEKQVALDKNLVDPRPFLVEKGLLKGGRKTPSPTRGENHAQEGGRSKL